jgi:hypothetical protein
MEEKLKVGKIYKIIDNTNGNIYIGSTTQTLNQRLNEHKCDYNRYLNNKIRKHCTSSEIIKNNNYKFEIIKYVVFEDRKELHQRERYYLENNICVNKFIPSRTKQQYYCNNKDYIKEFKKEYNKIKFQCECGSLIRKDNKQKHFRSKKHIDFINNN